MSTYSPRSAQERWSDAREWGLITEDEYRAGRRHYAVERLKRVWAPRLERVEDFLADWAVPMVLSVVVVLLAVAYVLLWLDAHHAHVELHPLLSFGVDHISAYIKTQWPVEVVTERFSY